MFCNTLQFPRSKRVDLTSADGFSLIELITVIAILAILVAIAYPKLLASKSKSQTRATASEIFSSFRSARIEAVKRNTNVCLVFQTNGTYKAFLDDGSGGGPANVGNRVQDGTEATLFSKQVQPDTSIISALTAGYNSQGRPLGGILGSVTVQNDRNTNIQYKSSLSIAGRVDLKVSTDGGDNWD